jgi:hypothetical protein
MINVFGHSLLDTNDDHDAFWMLPFLSKKQVHSLGKKSISPKKMARTQRPDLH